MSGTSCKNKHLTANLLISGETISNAIISPEHRSIANELIHQILQQDYIELQQLLNQSSSSNNNNSLNIDSSTFPILKQQDSDDFLNSSTTPNNHQRVNSNNTTTLFSSPPNSISNTNSNTLGAEKASLSSDELDRMVMPPPSIKLSSVKKSTTSNSITTPSTINNPSNLLSSISSNSEPTSQLGIELCILSNTTNEMIFIDPNLVKYSTKNNVSLFNSMDFTSDRIISPQVNGGVNGGALNENSPSLIVSPRLRHQHSRWSTYYTSGSTIALSDFSNFTSPVSNSVNNENNSSILSIVSSNTLNSTPQSTPSTQSIANNSANSSAVNESTSSSHGSIDESSPRREDLKSNTSSSMRHHHTISSLNKKEFQQFLPRVNLPSYGDISSVFKYSNVETMNVIGSRTSFHMLPSSDNSFSKPSFFSKSFTFGGDKQHANVSIGTTMTFSSMTVPKSSPRSQEAASRRLSRNSHSFFGKQYMKENQQPSSGSKKDFKDESSTRDSIVETLNVQDYMTRRYTEGGDNVEHQAPYLSIAGVATSSSRRSTTTEIHHEDKPLVEHSTSGYIKGRGSTATPLPNNNSPPNITPIKSHVKTLSIDVKKHERTPSSPLDINTSLKTSAAANNLIPKTPDKKKSSTNTVSSKVKEWFSSIGRRSRRKSNVDSFDNTTDGPLPLSPPLPIQTSSTLDPATLSHNSATDLMGTSPYSNSSMTPPVALDANILLSSTPSSSGSLGTRGLMLDDDSSVLPSNTQSAPVATNGSMNTSTSLSSSPPLSIPGSSQQSSDETTVITDMSKIRRASEVESTPLSPSRRRSSMKRSPKRRDSTLASTPNITEIDQDSMKYLTNLIVDFKNSSMAFSKLVEEFSLFDSLEKVSVDQIVQSPLSVEAPRGTKNRRPTSMHYISSSNTPTGRLSSDLSSFYNQQLAPITATPSIFHCINERSTNFSLIVLNEITLCLWYSLDNQQSNNSSNSSSSGNIGGLTKNQKSLLFGGQIDERLKDIGSRVENKLRDAFVANKSTHQQKQAKTLTSSKSMEFSFFNKKLEK